MTNNIGVSGANGQVWAFQLLHCYTQTLFQSTPQAQPELNEGEALKWSGRKDLNLRPPGPEPGALARLRYAPTVYAKAAPNSRANRTRIAQLLSRSAVQTNIGGVLR
jgi:hypothetical protein